MKVEGSPSVSFKTTNIVPTAVPYRTGDIVVVQALKVQNITENMSEVLLKFPEGDLLTAVLKGGYTGKEGDFFSIRIQSFEDKRIYANIVNNVDNSKTLKNEITHLLTTLSVPNTEENFKIAMEMLRSGLPQTSNNFNLIIKNVKRYPQMAVEQLALMIKNNIPINDQSIKTIELMMSHKSLIGEELILLMSLINKNEKNEELKSLLKKFYKNPQNNEFNYKDINSNATINDLVELISYLKEHKSLGEGTNDAIKAFIDNVKSEFEISKNLQNLLYLQIPINNNGVYDTAELYVLNDRDGRQEEKKQTSMFLRIPTLNIGLLEVMLNLDNKNLQCHFNSEQIDYIQKNITTFHQIINGLGFRVTNITYNHLPSDISIHNFEKYVELILDKKKFDLRV